MSGTREVEILSVGAKFWTKDQIVYGAASRLQRRIYDFENKKVAQKLPEMVLCRGLHHLRDETGYARKYLQRAALSKPNRKSATASKGSTYPSTCWQVSIIH